MNLVMYSSFFTLLNAKQYLKTYVYSAWQYTNVDIGILSWYLAPQCIMTNSEVFISVHLLWLIVCLLSSSVCLLCWLGNGRNICVASSQMNRCGTHESRTELSNTLFMQKLDVFVVVIESYVHGESLVNVLSHSSYRTVGTRPRAGSRAVRK